MCSILQNHFCIINRQVVELLDILQVLSNSLNFVMPLPAGSKQLLAAIFGVVSNKLDENNSTIQQYKLLPGNSVGYVNTGKLKLCSKYFTKSFLKPSLYMHISTHSNQKKINDKQMNKYFELQFQRYKIYIPVKKL